MQINEVIKQVDLSKHAIKYYEKVGLLEVAKGENGYRIWYAIHDEVIFGNQEVIRELAKQWKL